MECLIFLSTQTSDDDDDDSFYSVKKIATLFGIRRDWGSHLCPRSEAQWKLIDLVVERENRSDYESVTKASSHINSEMSRP